jgi:hypothetical protein
VGFQAKWVGKIRIERVVLINVAEKLDLKPDDNALFANYQATGYDL